MPTHDQSMKPFDTTPREELEGYARDFALGDTSNMSDSELRKRLRDVQGNTGIAGESDQPVQRKGDPGRGPKD